MNLSADGCVAKNGAAEGRILVGDININYKIIGSGFPLVIITGLGSNLSLWPQEVIIELARFFRLILFDNRGAGRTDAPEGEYSMKMFASDTAGLMKALGIPRAHVLGASMGGMIAQVLALHYPEKVEKLVLACTSCGGPRAIPIAPEAKDLTSERNVAKEDLVKKRIKLSFSKQFLRECPDKVESYIGAILANPISEKAYMQQFDAVARFDNFRDLAQIKAKTLVITGSEDKVIPPGNSKILVRRIPNAQHVVIKGAGHSFFREKPLEFCLAVQEYLMSV